MRLFKTLYIIKRTKLLDRNKEKYKQLTYPEMQALELSDFKAMDFFAVDEYELPIELMMENAGLQLANLIANFSEKNQVIKIGIGNGNNGGGGLVAARRLAAWGYKVYLDLFNDITKGLAKSQLSRALTFGVQISNPSHYDVWVDAYLGFSQRLPLPDNLLARCDEANSNEALKISLDLPTGFNGDRKVDYFKCDKILTLAAPKKVLYKLPKSTEIFVADIGIPKAVYQKFGIDSLGFDISNILKLAR